MYPCAKLIIVRHPPPQPESSHSASHNTIIHIKAQLQRIPQDNHTANRCDSPLLCCRFSLTRPHSLPMQRTGEPQKMRSAKHKLIWYESAPAIELGAVRLGWGDQWAPRPVSSSCGIVRCWKQQKMKDWDAGSSTCWQSQRTRRKKVGAKEGQCRLLMEQRGCFYILKINNTSCLPMRCSEKVFY